MKTHRPIIISSIITWFFLFHVALPYTDLLVFVVDLAKVFTHKGYYSFYAEYSIRIKDLNYMPMITGSVLAVFLFGAWNMRRWGLLGLLVFLSYLLWRYLTAKHFAYWSILALSISIFAVLRNSYWRPAKVVEKPETHLYEGPVSKSSHEPKSAVDDIIY